MTDATTVDAGGNLGALGASPEDQLLHRSVRSTLWVAADQAATQLVQIVVYIVLAHLLQPHAFGVMAMATVFVGFVTLLGQLGVESALVQARRLDAGMVSAAFWGAVAVNSVLVALFAALAPAVAGFYHQPSLEPIVLALAAAPLLGVIASVPRGLLARELRFRPVFMADVAAIAVSAAASIGAAAGGMGAMSLAIGLLARAAVQAIVLIPAVEVRLLLTRPDWRNARGLSAYTTNLIGFNVINYWSRNADNLLIGRFLGAVSLGLYERAYLLMLYPLTQVVATISRVLVSSLSRMGDDIDRVGRSYVRAVGAMCVITVPMTLALAALAEPFVLTVFGETWRPMIPLVRILAVVAALQSAVSPVGLIYQSQGRTRLMLLMGTGNAVVFVTAIGIGVAIGSPTAVAACYAVATVLVTYPTVAVPARLAGTAVSAIARRCAGPTISAVAMAAVVAIIDALLATEPAMLRLAVGAAVAPSVYFALLRFGNVRAARDLWETLYPLLPAHLRRAGSAAPT
jgi:O-antigen/teichoic acid export membrane protein